ncbi:TMV resistance protein N-like [Vicia villosa]|uniref:TMV resistance protein N-like n=1 Tax=Vicia villosa TaxID=3911 RepID=UPI00273C6499|nr:TMV resistance protein N-like [Vicia villosa]
MAGQASFFYDVFLSFRGDDTRYGFTGNLHTALHQRGIQTFFDDHDIPKGEELTSSLVKAIKDSKIAIVVFSKNYAFSKFCLKELTEILDCYEEKKKNGRMVLPVFYKVNPSDVRYGRGSYGEALAKHEEAFKDDLEMVNKWRTSLHKAANLKGFHFKHGEGYEYQLIASIFKEVSLKINRTLLHVANYPVGLESRVDKVNSLLNIPSNDVDFHMVGIHGIGGIGKSTVARSVYNSISDKFEGFCCFLEDVRVSSHKYGLLNLQETVLSEILGDKKIRLGNVRNGMSIIQQKLSNKKVLLVLDDVDQKEQLQAIVGSPNWFGSGSIIIITTRDKDLLTHYEVKSKLYEVEELNDKEACELLSWNAFKTDKADPKYTDILNRALCYASRLPLALEVVGSNLFGKGEEECKLILDRYDRIPDKKIQDILRVSVDSLDEDDRDVFLDIACCFGGYKLSDVENILHAHHGSSMRRGIELLIERSLIKLDDGLVTLHELIQDMGREIVRQESKEPNERSRLWNFGDVVQVLEENMGTSKTHMLILDFPKDEGHVKGSKGEVVNWDGEALKEMKNLKTLIIRNGHFNKGPTRLPNSLRVLKWHGYASSSLPHDFHPRKLCILELPDSCLKPCEPIQAFAYLRILDFSYSEYITEIPDVSGLPDLEKLSFKHCENLTKIHESVGYLGSLKILDGSSCMNLNTFPPIILTSLEQLNLSHCSNLESFPEILGKMENITELHIMGSPIKELPFSFQNLTRLRKLELQICGMVQLPSCIFMLSELSLMHVSKCEGLWLSGQDRGKEMALKSSNVDRLILTDCNISNDFLPIGLNIFSNVKDLNLSGNNFTTVHSWIKECHFLRNLKLDNCSNLQEISGIPKKLETFSVKGCTSLKCLDLTVLPACTAESCSLKELILDDCVYLQEIARLPQNLDVLSAKNCTALTSQSINMLMNQRGVQAGNKIFVFPGKKIPEWFRHCLSVKKAHASRVVRKQEIAGSFSFWFRNKFPAISLCLVIGLGNEQPIAVNFSPRVFINGHKQCIGGQKVYNFIIATDHVLLLNFEDSEDIVFSDNEWNHAEVSYVDHITYDEVPIRQVVRYSGIHVFGETTDPGNFCFTKPPQTVINANSNPNSMEGTQQGVKVTEERPRRDQTKVQAQLRPPIAAAAKKDMASKPLVPAKRSLEDVVGETSERIPEEEVHPTSISNDHPVIQSCCEGDDIELEGVSSSDSDDPFDHVDRRLGISAEETISAASSSGVASLGSIRAAINSLELLMAKDLSEFSCDLDTQYGLHHLLDLLSTSRHPKVSLEVKEAIAEFKRKSFLSFQEFQSTVESVNKLKDFEKHLDRIQQESMAGKGQRKELKSSIKKVSLGIKAENRRNKESDEEISTLRMQLAKKERDLEQLVLNLENQEESLSTFSTNYASLNEQARALLKEADDLLATSCWVKHEGEAAEVEQDRLKSIWSIGLTSQFNEIKKTFF